MDAARTAPVRGSDPQEAKPTCYALLLSGGAFSSAVNWLAAQVRPDRDTVLVIGLVPAPRSRLPVIAGVMRQVQRARAARRAARAVGQLRHLVTWLHPRRAVGYGNGARVLGSLSEDADVIVLPVDAWEAQEELLDQEIEASPLISVLVPPRIPLGPRRHEPVVALSSSGRPDAARFGLTWATSHGATLVASTFLSRRVRADEWSGADPAVLLTHEQLAWDATMVSVRGDATATPVIAEVLDDDLPITLRRLARTAQLVVVDREDYEAWRPQLYEDLLLHSGCALVVLPAYRPSGECHDRERTTGTRGSLPRRRTAHRV